MISFLWSSKSQHLSIISSEFLYSQSKHIAISPISVTPSAIELSPPVNCQVSVVDWNQLEVEWEEPLDDGGDAIQIYKVEYWDNKSDLYGEAEIQRIRFSKEAQGQTFLLQTSGDSIVDQIEVGTTALILKSALEALTW